MDKSLANKILEQVRKDAIKRKFSQSVDFIINLKDLDLKKPENQLDLFISLPHVRGKKVKTCAIIGGELAATAKENCDLVISNDQFPRYTGNKKEIKKLANEYDFFIAQANIMPEIAKIFGSVLGPRKRMPNPKAGCVVPPNANLKILVDRLQKTVRVQAKTEYSMKCSVGLESMSNEQLSDNLVAIYNAIVGALPSEKNNIKNMSLKLTMGKPVKISEEVKNK
ncbi:MAG: 50S ribosomal protein L1 [Nanoarchaeota archaeon]